MEWHRHRVHPVLWQALRAGAPKGVARRELDAFTAKEKSYLARRPRFSQTKDKAPWE
ncbi:MAG: hypothetical protein HY908_25610 [Myxococcales bacterium]|nr:hypothetical protein [Myxococcales bacterium]